MFSVVPPPPIVVYSLMPFTFGHIAYAVLDFGYCLAKISIAMFQTGFFFPQNSYLKTSQRHISKSEPVFWCKTWEGYFLLHIEYSWAPKKFG